MLKRIREKLSAAVRKNKMTRITVHGPKYFLSKLTEVGREPCYRKDCIVSLNDSK